MSLKDEAVSMFRQSVRENRQEPIGSLKRRVWSYYLRKMNRELWLAMGAGLDALWDELPDAQRLEAEISEVDLLAAIAGSPPGRKKILQSLAENLCPAAARQFEQDHPEDVV
jgi:hypothetical protein